MEGGYRGQRSGHTREGEERPRPERTPHGRDPDIEELNPRFPECRAGVTGQARQFVEALEHEPMADPRTADRFVTGIGNRKPLFQEREQSTYPFAMGRFQSEHIRRLPLGDSSVRPGDRSGREPARMKTKPAPRLMTDGTDRPDEFAICETVGHHGTPGASGGMEIHPDAGVDARGDMDREVKECPRSGGLRGGSPGHRDEKAQSQDAGRHPKPSGTAGRRERSETLCHLSSHDRQSRRSFVLKHRGVSLDRAGHRAGGARFPRFPVLFFAVLLRASRGYSLS